MKMEIIPRLNIKMNKLCLVIVFLYLKFTCLTLGLLYKLIGREDVSNLLL